MKEESIRGSLASVIRNDAGLYEGDLAHYFRALFNNAPNLNNPYHNFRHITHVLWLCHNACQYYKGSLSKLEMRSLLIAALFHDYGHTGRMGNDDVNILLAIRGFEVHIAPEDKPHLEQITSLIKATQYPYVVPEDQLDLCGFILRDADLSQSLSVAWIQQVVFGLAAEWGKKPIEVLRTQIDFLRKLKYNTDWAKESFDLEQKLAEVNEFLDLLEFGTDPALVKK